MDDAYHIPVLLDEIIECLVTVREGRYVDGTLGGGGHAEKILEKIYPSGTLIGIDADADAQNEARQRLNRFHTNVIFVHNNTSHISSILQSLHIQSIHGLLLDLGVSSFQIDEGSKGFSFRGNDRLDMRMDNRQTLDAHTIINSYSEEQLANIFFHYGEEKFSRRIARMVAERRMLQPIDTTGDLAALIESKVHPPYAIKTLARIFQALRIEVNNELERLQTILNDSLGFLARGGRIVVISYHSLEDRIVKNFFAQHAATVIRSGNKYMPDTELVPSLRILTKKPVLASEEEQKRNPRSRSAKMRVAEKM